MRDKGGKLKQELQNTKKEWHVYLYHDIPLSTQSFFFHHRLSLMRVDGGKVSNLSYFPNMFPFKFIANSFRPA